MGAQLTLGLRMHSMYTSGTPLRKHSEMVKENKVRHKICFRSGVSGLSPKQRECQPRIHREISTKKKRGGVRGGNPGNGFQGELDIGTRCVVLLREQSHFKKEGTS